MFSTAEAAMNHIVLEGIVSMTGQPTNVPSSSYSKVKCATSNGEEPVTNGSSQKKKVSKNDNSIKQKPLDGWIQDITTSAWDVREHQEDFSVEDNDGSGSLSLIENWDFIYRTRGFKLINIVNFEADGHVIVQVLESSFKLYQMAQYKYDETKPAKELRENRYYFAKVYTGDGTVFGNRAEYRGEARAKGFVEMYFSDIGQTVTISRNHVYEIDNYLDAVRLPPQAVKVSVAGLTNMGYSIDQLHESLDEWLSGDETYFMMRVKPLKKEKYIERSTGVPKVLIMNRAGRALGIWKR